MECHGNGVMEYGSIGVRGGEFPTQHSIIRVLQFFFLGVISCLKIYEVFSLTWKTWAN